MRYNHFSMLPERAFQPRGPFGMTLEGGAFDFVSDVFEGAVDIVEDVGDFFQEEVLDPISDAGSAIDDFVNEEIPGGWVTVAAVTAATVGMPSLPGSETAAAGSAGTGTAAGLGAADAVTAAEWFGGTGAATAPGAIFGAETVLPSVAEMAASIGPSVGPGVATPNYSLLGGAELPVQNAAIGGSGTGLTPGAGGVTGATAPTVPSVAEMGGAQGITVPAAGGTITEAGLTATGAVPVLGAASSMINQPTVLGTPVIGQTAATAGGINALQALQAANLANSMMNPPQQQQAQQQIGDSGAAAAARGVDYSALLGLLSQRAQIPGLLGTQFQVQPINLLSLLG